MWAKLKVIFILLHFFKEKKRFFSQKEDIKTHASVHKLITGVSKELFSPFPSSHNSTVLFFMVN